jgi:glucose-1-phosphate thymidylyltransferase
MSDERMQAVVPAAGEGTRLRPLTADQPKGLVEIHGRPLLAYCFDRLVELPVAEIVVVVGYRGEEIRDHFGPAYDGVSLSYVRQDEQAGLAHAILQADSVVDDDFLVLNGDNVFGGSLEGVAATHRGSSADVTVLVEEATRSEATRTGVVVTDSAGRVTELVEKPADPPSTTITTGCYALPPEFFPACRAVDPSSRGELELPDVIGHLIDHGATVQTATFEGWRVNVNTQSDLERAAENLDE